jgi:chemotaxis signal transduction protein
VCLLVDEVLDIVDVSLHALEPVPETLAPGLRVFASGTYPLNSGLLLALNAETLTEALEEGFSPARQVQTSTSLRFKRST